MIRQTSKLGTRLLFGSRLTESIPFGRRLPLTAGTTTPSSTFIFARHYSFCSEKNNEGQSKPAKNTSPNTQKSQKKQQAIDQSPLPPPKEPEGKGYWAKLKRNFKWIEAKYIQIPMLLKQVFKGILMVIGLLIARASLMQSKEDSPKNLQKQEDVKILELYGKQNLSIPKNYVKNNSIERQIQRIVFYEAELAQMIIGVPGSGKSTATRHIVQKLRKKGDRQVFYIDLRPEDQIKTNNSSPFFGDLKKLALAIGRRDKKSDKLPPLLFIDDINQIENRGITQVAQIQEQMVQIALHHARVFAISSSSKYFDKAIKNSVIWKNAQNYTIQRLTKDQKAEVIESMIEDGGFLDFEAKQSPQALRASKEFKELSILFKRLDYNFKRVKLLAKYIKNRKKINLENPNDPERLISSEQVLAAVKEQVALIQQKSNIQIDAKISKLNTSDQLKQMLIEGVLSFEDKINVIDCGKLSQSIKAKNIFRKSQVEDAIQNLKNDLDDYLIYCHPRSGLERRVFEVLLQQQRESQSRENK